MNGEMQPELAGKMHLLMEMSHAFTNAASLDDIFQLAVERAADLLAAKRALLLVANEDGLLAMRSSHGVDPALASCLAVRFREPLNETVVARLAAFLDAQPDNVIGVPMIVGGAIKGILVVLRPKSSQDAEHDEWLLSALADQAAVAHEMTRLNQIGEFREQLIGIMGHDLRNPLGTIAMGAELLLEGDSLGVRDAAVVKKISSSAAQASRLVEQLLDLTRSRLGGGIPIDLARVDLNEICRQVVDETQLSHPDRPLWLEAQGDLTGMFDRDRMYQLIANLVGNAVRHGAPRSTIALSLHRGTTEIIIEVSNQGEPIPAAMLPFIFEAFRKKPSVHPSRSHGLGLGLFIAQQVARSHGGAITVRSSESEGTTFRIRLPVTHGDAKL
jgi:phosphoserine phosphatase RsbU/P